MPKKTKAKKSESLVIPWITLVISSITLIFVIVSIGYMWYYSSVLGPMLKIAQHQLALQDEVEKMRPVATEDAVVVTEEVDSPETITKALVPKIISDIYFSERENLLLVISPGEYCGSGTLYKYDIKEDSLEEVVLDKKGRGCVSSMRDFGKREGSVLEITGFGGDAGCGVSAFYEYNIFDNQVELKKELISCEGDIEDQLINY